MGQHEGPLYISPHLAVHLWRNRRQLCRGAVVGPQLEIFLDLFLKRDPQAATTWPSFLYAPRLSLGDEPASASCYGSNVTRHQSPLLQGDRSGVTYTAAGDTLGSEARSTTPQYDDEEHGSGGGLSPIPEGEEGGPPSPNATVSEGAAIGVAQKEAEIQKLSTSKSAKKSGGQSWLTHSDQCALELSQVIDSCSTLGPEARLVDRRLFQTLITVVNGPSLQLLLEQVVVRVSGGVL